MLPGPVTGCRVPNQEPVHVRTTGTRRENKAKTKARRRNKSYADIRALLGQPSRRACDNMKRGTIRFYVGETASIFVASRCSFRISRRSLGTANSWNLSNWNWIVHESSVISPSNVLSAKFLFSLKESIEGRYHRAFNLRRVGLI